MALNNIFGLSISRNVLRNKILMKKDFESLFKIENVKQIRHV